LSKNQKISLIILNILIIFGIVSFINSIFVYEIDSAIGIGVVSSILMFINLYLFISLLPTNRKKVFEHDLYYAKIIECNDYDTAYKYAESAIYEKKLDFVLKVVAIFYIALTIIFLLGVFLLLNQ